MMTIILPHLYFFVLVAASLTIIYTEAEENQIIRKQIRNQRRQLRPIDNDNDNDNDNGTTGDNYESKYANTEKDDDFITGLQTYIVNGNDSSGGRYPYQAMLFRETGPNARFGCGGSLIAPDIVLSAAHCGIPKQVEIGRDSRVEDNGNFDRRDVLYSYRHPRNDKQSYAYDLLLLKLSAPSTKRPIRLNDNPALPIVNQLVTVTGFGKLAYNGVPSITLQEVELNAMSNDVCSMSKDLNSKREDFQQGYEGLIQDNMLCLNDLSGSKKDACSGDSGGPAILRGNTSEEDIQVGKLEEVYYILDSVACHIYTHKYLYIFLCRNIYLHTYITNPFLLSFLFCFCLEKKELYRGDTNAPCQIFPVCMLVSTKVLFGLNQVLVSCPTNRRMISIVKVLPIHGQLMTPMGLP